MEQTENAPRFNRQQRRELKKIHKRKRIELARKRDKACSKLGVGSLPEDIERTYHRVMGRPIL